MGRIRIWQKLALLGLRLFCWMLCLSLLLACQDSSQQETSTEMPKQIIIEDLGHSAASAKKYVIRDDSLFVLQEQNNPIKADSLLYKQAFRLEHLLQEVNAADLLSLKNRYSNECVMDGSLITVSLRMKSRTKTVQLQNAYQETIGKLIRNLNAALPAQHQIWYDKEELLLGQERCYASL